MFAHNMVRQDIHALYYAVLAYIACCGQQVLVIVVDAGGNNMADPYGLADALQILHHLVGMRTLVTCKAGMQFIVHGLYVKQNQVRYFQKTAHCIVEDYTAGIQSRVYALLLAQTEVFLHEGGLDKGFAASAGNTAGLDEIAILQCFFQQLLGSPFVFDWSLQIPGVGIVAEKTTHGTTLHEGKETDTGTVDSAKGFQRVDTTYVHKSTDFRVRISEYRFQSTDFR